MSWLKNAFEYIQCPFCHEADFDLTGLKNHFERGWCDAYNTTPSGDEDLEKVAKPFVSLQETPVVEEFEPEEKFQAPNQNASSGHSPEVRMDK